MFRSADPPSTGRRYVFFSGMIGFLITRICLFLIEKEEQENTFD